MDGHQALEVILRPCPGIVSREVALQILGKVTGRAVRDSETALNRLSVDTSILSLFCSELYQKAVEADADVITEELVGQFGDDIIASFYEDTMKLVSNETMEYLEAHLLTYSGFRNTVALEDLTQNGIKPEELEKLAEKRLVRIETLDGTERVEFMHDVLCKVAKEHRDARKEEIRQNVRLKRLRRNNIGFLTSAIVGLITLVVFSWLHSQLFGYMPLCGTLSFELPYVLFFSFLLGGVYLLLFENKISKYLIIRYLLVLIIAMLMVVGIYSIQTFLYNDDNWLRRWYIHRYADMDDISVRFVLFVLCLIVSYIMDCFSKRKAILVISKTLVMLTLVRAVIIMGFSGAWALIFYFFALFILLPYRFTIEKNAWWITLLSFIMVIWALLLLYPEDDVAVPCFIVLLLSIGLSVYYLVRYKKEQTAKEAWDYCISLKSYKEHPFFVKTMAVIALLLVLVFSVQVGLRLVDRYTLLGIAFFVPVSYALINFLTFGTANLRLKFSAPSILFLLLLAGIVVSQYLYGRLLWLVLVWLAAAYYVYKYSKLYNHSAASRWTIKKDVLPCFVIWFVSFFCIPILCMGYNVFSLPKYARVYNKNAVYVEYSCPFIPIKDNNGKNGVRSRDGLLVPMGFKSVFRIDSGIRHGVCPYAFFEVTMLDGTKHVWDCSEHLEMKNTFTKRYLKFCGKAIDGAYDIGNLDMEKYINFVYSVGMQDEVQKAIEYSIIQDLNDRNKYRTSEYYVKIRSINELKHRNKEIEASTFISSISNSAKYFSRLDSLYLSRLMLDTLYVKCNNYPNTVNYSDLVYYRILMKDYDRSVSDARKAISRKERFAESRLIEALYFNGQYDEAFELLNCNKNNLINIGDENDDDKYKYLGDVVWQDMLKYKNLGLLQDTLSQQYSCFKDILKLEVDHPYYDHIVRMNQFLPGDEKRELCIKDYRYRYLLDNHKRVSPIISAFAPSKDETIIMYVDVKDGKRRYMDLSNDSIRHIKGEFDFAWRFSEGLAAVSVDGKIGFINNKGDFVLSPSFPMHDYYSGYYKPYKFLCYDYDENDCGDLKYVNGKLFRRLSSCKKVSAVLGRNNNRFVDIIFQNGLCPMSGDNGCYGLIDKQGKWVVDPVYDYIGKPDSNGRRLLRKGDYGDFVDEEKKNIEYFEIDKFGKLISPVK